MIVIIIIIIITIPPSFSFSFEERKNKIKIKLFPSVKMHYVYLCVCVCIKTSHATFFFPNRNGRVLNKNKNQHKIKSNKNKTKVTNKCQLERLSRFIFFFVFSGESNKKWHCTPSVSFLWFPPPPVCVSFWIKKEETNLQISITGNENLFFSFFHFFSHGLGTSTRRGALIKRKSPCGRR